MKVAGDQPVTTIPSGRYNVRSFMGSSRKRILTRRHSGHFSSNGTIRNGSMISNSSKPKSVTPHATTPSPSSSSSSSSGSSAGIISPPTPVRVAPLQRPKSMPDLAAIAAVNADGMPPLPGNKPISAGEERVRPRNVSFYRPTLGSGHHNSSSRGNGHARTASSSICSDLRNLGVSSDGNSLPAALLFGSDSNYAAFVNDSRASIGALHAEKNSGKAATDGSSLKSRGRAKISTSSASSSVGTAAPSFVAPLTSSSSTTGTADVTPRFTRQESVDSSCIPPVPRDEANASAGNKCLGGMCVLEARPRSPSAGRRASRRFRSSSPSNVAEENRSDGSVSSNSVLNGSSRGSNGVNDAGSSRRSSSLGRRFPRSYSSSSRCSAGNNSTSPSPGQKNTTKLGSAIEAAQSALVAAAAAESPLSKAAKQTVSTTVSPSSSNESATISPSSAPLSSSNERVRTSSHFEAEQAMLCDSLESSGRRVGVSPIDDSSSSSTTVLSRTFRHKHDDSARIQPQRFDEVSLTLPRSMESKGAVGRVQAASDRREASTPESPRVVPHSSSTSEGKDSSPSLSRRTKTSRKDYPTGDGDNDDESVFSSEYESDDDEEEEKRSSGQCRKNSNGHEVGVSNRRLEDRKRSLRTGTCSDASQDTDRQVNDYLSSGGTATVSMDGGRGGVNNGVAARRTGARLHAGTADSQSIIGRARAEAGAMFPSMAGYADTANFADGVEGKSGTRGGDGEGTGGEGTRQEGEGAGGNEGSRDNSNGRDGDAERDGGGRGYSNGQEGGAGGDGGDGGEVPWILSNSATSSSSMSSSSSSAASSCSSRSSFSRPDLGGTDGIVEAFAKARGRARDVKLLESGRAAAELGGLLRQAVLGDWHTCAMPKRAPPRWKAKERAEWDAWVASEGVTKSEAMRIFTAAVDDLYSHTKEGTINDEALDDGIWPSPDKNASKKSGDSSDSSSININIKPNLGGNSVGGLALSAAPLFASHVSTSPDAGKKISRKTASERSPTEEILRASGKSREGESGAESTRVSTEENGKAERRVRSGSRRGGSMTDPRSAAAAAVSEEGPTKAGVLYKKREVLPGWRPRTFMLDARQRLLRYYLPRSARPRGSIPLDGCSVGTAIIGSDGKGEGGPDGRRLFRIKLVAGPAPPPMASSGSGGGSNGDGSRRSLLGSPGGDSEGFRKTYVLAATSAEEARAWVTAIKDAAVYTPPPLIETPPKTSRASRTRGEKRPTHSRTGSQNDFGNRPEKVRGSVAATFWPSISSKSRVGRTGGTQNEARNRVNDDRAVNDQPVANGSRRVTESPSLSNDVVVEPAETNNGAGTVSDNVSRADVVGGSKGKRDWKMTSAFAAGLLGVGYFVVLPAVSSLLSSAWKNSGSVILVMLAAAVASLFGSKVRAREKKRLDNVRRHYQDSKTVELEEEEEDNSVRYSVGFSVDVQSLQAELDRLRRRGVGQGDETDQGFPFSSSSTVAVTPGTEKVGTLSTSSVGAGDDAMWSYRRSAAGIVDRRGQAGGHGSNVSVGTPSVTVLHLVMKAAAGSLLEVLPAPLLARTGKQPGNVWGDAGSFSTYQDGATGVRKSRVADDLRRPTRVACTITRARNGLANGVGGRALVIIESAEMKSAGAIATEIASSTSASAAKTRRALLNRSAVRRNDVTCDFSGFGRGDSGWFSEHSEAMEKVPLLHTEDTDLAVEAVSQLGRLRVAGENSPEEKRAGWLELSAVRHAESIAAKKRLRGVPLLHADDIASVATGRDGSRFGCGRSAGRGQKARADCLVEIKPSTTLMSLGNSRSNGTDNGDRSGQRGRVRFADNTLPGRTGGRKSLTDSARSSSSITADLFGMEAAVEDVDDDDEEQPLEIAVIPDPGGEGVSSPLRVTVGRVSALKGSKREKGGRSDLGDGGVGPRSGNAGGPAIVLQVSVVGAGSIGAGATLEFAEALRRRLLAVDSVD